MPAPGARRELRHVRAATLKLAQSSAQTASIGAAAGGDHKRGEGLEKGRRLIRNEIASLDVVAAIHDREAVGRQCMLECIGGGLLFDVVQTMGGMGEDYGRFFMNQMLDSLEFMQAKGVSHRDLKLENILVDE